MRIAVSQIDTQAGDLAHTASRMEQQSQAAAGRGVDLLVFPVAALTGLLPVDYAARDPFALDLAETLSRLALRVACPCLVPVVVAEGDAPVTEALLLEGGVAVPLRFGDLAPKGVPDGLAPDGAASLVRLSVSGSAVGLAFSYEDLDDWRDLGRSCGVDVICYLASYGYAVDDPSSALGAALADNRYVDDARETGAWVVGVASLGTYGTSVFTGSSFVVDPEGRLAASSPAFEEDLLVAGAGRGVTLGAEDELTPELYDERYHLWQALVLGIEGYVRKGGWGDVCVALDGSLSSMLLAVVATDALGPTHVHALACVPGDAPRAREAALLVRALRIEARPCEPLREGDPALRTLLAQAQLLAYAREVGGVALLSSDKTSLALEAEVSVCGRDVLAPLGDVHRIDVLEVARLRNTISAVFPPLEVSAQDLSWMGKEPPPLDLEGTLRKLDATLEAHVEGEYGLTDAARDVSDDQTASAVLAAFRRLDAARASLPVCLALTSRPLSEVRMPLGFSWSDTLRDGVPASPGRAVKDMAASLGQHPSRDQRAPASRKDGPHDAVDVREALELLRDLSTDARPDWRGPFSEN